jgi:molybdopterin-binding protein
LATDYRNRFENALIFAAASAASARHNRDDGSFLLIPIREPARPRDDRARLDNVRTIMRISARNQIKGTVLDVKKGATTSHVRVDIGNGQIITSAITNEAVDELGIKAKGHVTVVVKASDVMIGLD